MLDDLKISAKKALKVVIALSPSIVAMYLLYWFETSKTWIPETLHRDKYTAAILLTGLGLSFFLQTYIAKKNKK